MALGPPNNNRGFDPTTQKAVWPPQATTAVVEHSTPTDGCRFSTILPQEMSSERFTWLRDYVGSEVIATPGCESNVKEIYDKCWELRLLNPTI